MRQSVILFVFLLVLNLCITIGYIAWNYIRQKEMKLSIWMKAGLMLVCPVVGVSFWVLAYGLYWLFMSQAMDLEDVIFKKEKSKNAMKPDEEREKNIASLEESLLISEKHDLRNLMMNIVKGEYKDSLAAISLALNSEDSETSHYAASILQDVLNEFRADVQIKYKTCQNPEEESCLENCLSLIEYMNPIVDKKVFSDMEQHSMVEQMEAVCQQAWEIDPSKIQSRIYECVSMRLLEIKEYELCRKWCLRAAQQYPQTLSSYTCQLKLYFTCKEREAFFEVLDAVKKSDIVLDNETLELIRIFMV